MTMSRDDNIVASSTTFISVPRRANKQLINFIPAFVDIREPPYRTDLGVIEPLNYPANYSVDEKFPIFDAETNATHVE